MVQRVDESSIIILHDARLQRLNLQRQQLRIKAAKREIPAEEPEPGMSAAPPHGSGLTLIIISPHVPDPIGQFVAKDLSSCLSHVLEPGREDDLVGFELGVVGETDAVGLQACNLLALLDFDLLIRDELCRTDVDVVTPTTMKVLHKKPRAVGSVINGEASSDEASKEWSIKSRHLCGGVAVKSL